MRDPIGFNAGDLNVYRYVFDNPTNQTDPTGEDCPGCDIPDWALGDQANDSPCALACCAQHDKCYRDNDCTAWSWGWNIGGAVGGGWVGGWHGAFWGCELAGLISDCADCNNDVVACIAACAFGNHMAGKPLYYCPRQRRFIKIPKDFPDLPAAKAACCN